MKQNAMCGHVERIKIIQQFKNDTDNNFIQKVDFMIEKKDTPNIELKYIWIHAVR